MSQTLDTDPITIAEFKKLDPKITNTSCIQVKVTQVAESKEGISNGQDWKRQPIIVTDKTGDLKLSLFNGSIGKLELGKSYLICELTVASWHGQTTAKVLSDTTIREVAISSDEFLKNKQQVIQPKPDVDFEGKVIEQYHRIHAIEKILLKNYASEFESPEQRAKLGMYMKMIDDNIDSGKDE
jgi:hypothetical protein